MSLAPRLEQELREELPTRTSTALESLGLRTVGDLLRHLPKRYAHRGVLTPVGQVQADEHVTVIGRVVSNESRPMRNRKGFVTLVVITDGEEELRLSFFSQKQWSRDKFTRDLAPGTVASFGGKVSVYNGQRQLAHPEYMLMDASTSLTQDVDGLYDRPFPIYPCVQDLQSPQIQKMIGAVLDTLREQHAPDPLPDDVRDRHGVLDLFTTLHLVHRPASVEEAESARYRFVVEEAVVLQVALARRRAGTAALPATARPQRTGGLLDAFDAQREFVLTAGQSQVGADLAAELAQEHPMHRLLQGEVGSGKTLVALRAMLQVVDAGGQAALLAPTEVLAVQHHRSLTAMLGSLGRGGMLDGDANGTRVALLTGALGAHARRVALLDTAAGAAGIVVGTHALLSEGVQFADLGLVVVDEQHRFGVEQRDALRRPGGGGGAVPHVLVMTATPIPRTVAMTVFGDLETSTLTELPTGRRPITTHVVSLREKPGWLERVWARVAEEAGRGHGVFVVCPRIGDEEGALAEDLLDGAGDAEPAGDRPPLAANDVLALVRGHPATAGLRSEVLHGRMPADAKEAVMLAFAAGSVDVLVATTVVEVGVDVPRATVMVVMDADRFGVSQLHQLRGRVGRGGEASVCLLVTAADPDGPGMARLRAVEGSSDGFELSRVDLAQRREGDVLGALQAGRKSSLKHLSVLRHEDLIAAARQDAVRIVDEDPSLGRHPVLVSAIDAMLGDEREQFLERG